jgi:hypothetical protein
MADSLSRVSWIRTEFAVAVAVSRLAYGASGYAIYSDVWDWLQQGGFRADEANGFLVVDPNAGIANALGHSLNVDCDPAFVNACLADWGDDKGYADYVLGSFQAFGLRIQSLYYFYFLILGISVCVFCVDSFRDPATLVMAPLFLAAQYVAVLVLPDSQVTSVVHDAASCRRWPA